MGRHPKWNNRILIAVLDELLRMVGAVTVNNEQTLRSHLFCMCVLVEVLNPLYSQFIVGIAGRRNGYTRARVLICLRDVVSHDDLSREY